ncbi:MAG: efflux RND transporter periplasmic adaptor subunit [Desulfovibrionales bacterium]
MKRFEVKKSFLLAVAIVLVVGGWMASGLIHEDSAEAIPESRPAPVRIMTVEAARLTASQITRNLTVQGEIEPVKTATLRSETDGLVEKVLVHRGDRVEAGQVVAQLKLNDRQARLKEAQAIVRQRSIEHEAKKTLVKNGYLETIAEKEALAALESARAVLQKIELEMANTTIRVPFDGILERRTVEIGDLVPVNGEVGLVVDTSTLVAAGQVPQQEIQYIRPGAHGIVRFITGQQAEGRIRYIASMPDKGTQTFRVELEIANPDHTLPSGVSAEIVIPLENVHAHFLSPAALVLDETGTVGVKIVDHEDRVRFITVQPLRSEPGGVWVSGLPTTAAVITSGQGFVAPGEEVRVAYRNDNHSEAVQ